MNSTITPTHLLQVFEHQTLRIGDELNGCIFSKKHFHALVRYSEKNGGKYYTLLFNGVKFSHYVGAIQIGHLTIEILPKADKKENADVNQWHDVLMDMLKECRLIKVETLASARLQLRTNSILELYFEIFLKEIEKLLRKGLFRRYRKVEANVKFLKGKLIFHKNIQKNFAHQERFYAEYQQYDYDHLLNRILRRALDVLETLVLAPSLLSRVKEMKMYFPKSGTQKFTERDFLKFTHDRKTESYQTALEIARLLVLNFSPDLRGGKHHLLAIMFDMNVLFEEYVFRQLKRLENRNLEVKRQQRKPFFQRRKIQPDIVLTYFGKKYVLDTKWKVMREAKPLMSDLKQIYVYNKYFKAERSLLLYPNVFGIENLPPTPYHPTEKNPSEYGLKEEIMFCQICFLDIKSKNELNRNLGKDILLALR
ncbi:MAG: McrC family protein [Saprospiraceae bacterium]